MFLIRPSKRKPTNRWYPGQKRLRPASGKGNFQGRSYESLALSDARKRFFAAARAAELSPSPETTAELERSKAVYMAHCQEISQ